MPGLTTCPRCRVAVSRRGYRIHVEKCGTTAPTPSGGQPATFDSLRIADTTQSRGGPPAPPPMGTTITLAPTPQGAATQAQAKVPVRYGRAVTALVSSLYRALNRMASIPESDPQRLYLTPEEKEDIASAFQGSPGYVDSPWTVVAIIVIPAVGLFALVNLGALVEWYHTTLEKHFAAKKKESRVREGVSSTGGYVIEAGGEPVES